MGCKTSNVKEEIKTNAKKHNFYEQKLVSGEDNEDEKDGRWARLSRLSRPTMEFNDTIIKVSAMSQNSTFDTQNSTETRKTLTFVPLTQFVNFKIGQELMCMTWNLNHEQGGTPFDFYCDFRNLRLKERDVVAIEILWDVARVFLYTETPTELSKNTKLQTVVPSYLLSEETLNKFSDALKISGEERELVMKFPELSLNEFLLALSFDEDADRVLKDKGSFMKTNSKFSDRASSALRQDYSPTACKYLIKKYPAILPVLILDTLHTLTIRFSAYLLYNDIQKAFSEYESDQQIKKLKAYCGKTKPNDLALPKHFIETRKILYDKWNSVFKDDNLLTQTVRKVDTSSADIVLLQQVNKQLFHFLKDKMSDSYALLPEEFPSNLTHSTVICVKSATIKVDKENIRRVDDLNFAVPCQSTDINFFVGVINLAPGQGCGELRKKEATSFRRMIGKDPAIVGGNFNEDLSAFDNPVSHIMLKRFNGIDHSQAMPLSCTTNPTRTSLQFNVGQSGQREPGVDNGIYSTFPLVGDAWTDFLYPGKTNPSDRGPVFQRVALAMI